MVDVGCIFAPDPALSTDSTEGKGSASLGPSMSGGGGVSARCSGEALYEYLPAEECCRAWPRGRNPGGRDDRLLTPPLDHEASAADNRRAAVVVACIALVAVDGGKFGDCGICGSQRQAPVSQVDYRGSNPSRTKKIDEVGGVHINYTGCA